LNIPESAHLHTATSQPASLSIRKFCQRFKYKKSALFSSQIPRIRLENNQLQYLYVCNSLLDFEKIRMSILYETIPLKTNCASKEKLYKMAGWPEVHFVYVRIQLGKSRGFPNLLEKKYTKISSFYYVQYLREWNC
jgi:hypothetical protein